MSMTIGSRMTQPTVGMPGAGTDGSGGAAGLNLFGGGSSVVVGAASAGMPVWGAEQVDAAVVADITRDDWIGKMCTELLNRPAPAMPEVLKGQGGIWN